MTRREPSSGEEAAAADAAGRRKAARGRTFSCEQARLRDDRGKTLATKTRAGAIADGFA